MPTELIFFRLISGKDDGATEAISKAESWQAALDNYLTNSPVASLHVRVNDLIDPISLATKLHAGQDKLSEYLGRSIFPRPGDMPPGTKKPLGSYKAGSQLLKKQITALAAELNRKLRDPDLYKNIPDELLQAEIRQLIEANPDAESRIRFNRLVLERFYPDAVVKSLIIRDAAGNEEPAWVGCPFVLVGRKEEIIKFFSNQSEQAKSIFSNCDYYWILSDYDQDFLSQNLSLVAQDRTIVLNWDHKNYNVLKSQLASLTANQEIVGLSSKMGIVRREIARITSSTVTGPGTPVLILGQSGSGKELVAKSLYDSSDRGKKADKDRFEMVACGWFTKTLLQTHLFGIGPNVATNVKGRPGLLEIYSDGAVLIDDFDAAPMITQAALLRVLATPEEDEAIIHRVGEEEESQITRVWLLFSTNANIEKLLRKKRIREDFIFRFRDRVINIPPLSERPADIPAIAAHIWRDLWQGVDPKGQRPLSAAALQWLCARETQWKGNVRALQTLLSLAVSMAKLSVHKHQPLQWIFEKIMSRGPEYYHWVGIIATTQFKSPLPPEIDDPAVREVRQLDDGFDCFGPSQSKPAWPYTGSEREAESKWLTPMMRDRSKEVIKMGSGDKNTERASVRMSRAICYAFRKSEIDRRVYTQLSKIAATTASNELKMLAQAGLLKVKQSYPKVKGKPILYEPAS